MQTISQPCKVGDALEVTIDASGSKDTSGRPLASIQWSLVSGTDDSSKLQALLTAANARTGGAA